MLLPVLASAQPVFTDPSFSTQDVVALPQYSVTSMTWASDGRMFISLKPGIVRIYENGALNETPFLDISDHVNREDDRGMLGLALDPNFQNNGYVYLSYVYEGGGNPFDAGPKISRLTRVTADPSNPDVALPGSEVILIDNIPADATSHTLGSLRFASDGTLFVSNGDGGTATQANTQATGSQDIDSLRGKILRVNRDGTAPAPPQATNPFYDGTNSNRSKVWAYGFRNPFKFDISPTFSDVYACDVGWNTYEEVNHVVAGADYGWPCYEGFYPQPDYQSIFPQLCETLTPANVTMPLYSYDHTQGSAAVGCTFFSGSAYPAEYQGNLFFSDYTGGWMRRLVLDSTGGMADTELFATNVGSPVAMGLGPDGLLYYADFVSGEIRRIVRSGPNAIASVTPGSGYSPLHVTFSSAGSTGNSLTYSWDFGDGGHSTAANPTHTYTSGVVQTYVATLTVKNAINQTSSAQVNVTIGSLPPTATILQPTPGLTVLPGQTISYSGTATDPDETLDLNTALSWTILLHHNTHVHTHEGSIGPSGSFVAEYHGVGTYSYELILTATDSSGLTGSASVTVPVLADTSPPTDPASLSATIAGGNAADLSWTGSTDNAAVAFYGVERCTGINCTNFVQVGTSTTPSYTDGGLSPSTHYTYRVRAFDATGNASGYSNTFVVQTSGGGGGGPPPGLVAAYNFDEGTGTTLTDYSGHGNTGALVGPTWTQAGHFGGALSFDGNGSFVDVNDSVSLHLTTGMTLEAWLYPTTQLSYWHAAMQKAVDDFFLNANTGGDKIGVGGTFAGTCCTVVEAPTALPVNQWTHVAGTYDGTTLRLYVNGALVGSQAQTGSLAQSGLPLRIGGSTYSGEWFTGKIDNVRIYNRALSLTEIQHDMNTPVQAIQVPVMPPTLAVVLFVSIALTGAILCRRRSVA